MDSPLKSAGATYFDALSEDIEAVTLRHTSELGLANAELNLPHIEQTIRELAGEGEGRTCLIVSGGPSMSRRDSLERLKPVIDKFLVVAADGGMGHCLRAGIIPDYVLTVDPDRERIVRWYGDDNLTEENLKDDYFRRQDLDEDFRSDEVEKNERQIQRVNDAGPSMKAVLGTSVCEDVRRRCFDSGMDVYWWNPIYDDVSDAGSLTRALYRSNKVPCMNAGGNVGTAACVFAMRILKAPRIVMIGMDFSYYADTPLEQTQYYDKLKSFISESDLPSAFKVIHNPHLDRDSITDPAYYWYRQGFLELIESMDGCEIVNATEGGILFGDAITWKSIDEVIEIMNEGKS